MRNPWKMLLFQSFSRVPVISRIDSLHNHVRNLSSSNASFIHSYVSRNAPEIRSLHHMNRFFSSEPVLEQKDPDHALFGEIFSKNNSSDEIKNKMNSLNVVLDHENILSMLRNLDESPEVALRFFDFVSETENGKLSSKSYNLILGILGRKDHRKEFWDLVEVMKKKGYGISKNTYKKVSEKFSEEGLLSDSDLLKDMYTSRSSENSFEGVCSRICKVVREGNWDEDVQKKLEELNVGFSSNLVAMVLEHLDIYPVKALMFFRWIEEKQSFKHDLATYNAMAQVLGREDCIEEFWVVVNEMKGAGFEMEMDTYVKVLGRFYKRKMVKEAVDLYEFMMGGSHKPPIMDWVLLLRKIVSFKETDMDLFSRVLTVYTQGGNVLTSSIFDGVLKSLRGAGKLGECDQILKAMEKGGLVASSSVHSQAVLGLCKSGKLDEAYEFVDGHVLDKKPWVSLVEGHCAAGELEKASSCFQKMVEKKGAAEAGRAFEVLVSESCRQGRPHLASKFLVKMVDKKQLQPWHTTYKILIEKLLGQGSLKDALSLLPLMISDGFPPFTGPFMDYISKSGTGDDALSFLKAMTVKRFPSTTMFLLMFESLFKAGRHNVAHDLLSKCPGYIRGHADVLELFYNMKPEANSVVA